MKGLEVLQEKLVKHKECLKDVDVQIKRINGREEAANTPSVDAKTNNGKNTENNENNSSLVHRSLSGSNGNRRDVFSDTNRNRTLKRRHDDSRYNSNNNRNSHPSDNESDVEEPKTKHTLQSSVVSKQAVIKSKDDLIKLQNKNPGSEQRNKRIFGMILGTLQKFKTDDKLQSETSQARQRKEIEKKIEVKELEEKTKIKEERSELYKEKRRQQIQIRAIEQKLRMVEELENWCKQQNNYKKFIKTQTKPYLFYLPKVLDTKTEKLLTDCAAKIDAEIVQRKADTEKELENLASHEQIAVAKNENQNSEDKNGRLNKSIESDLDSDDMDDEDEHVNDVKIGDDDDDDEAEKSLLDSSKQQNDEANESKIEETAVVAINESVNQDEEESKSNNSSRTTNNDDEEKME